MGVTVSQTVKSRLERSTLNELLSDEAFVATLQNALPELENYALRHLKRLCPVSGGSGADSASEHASASERITREGTSTSAGIDAATAEAATALAIAQNSPCKQLQISPALPAGTQKLKATSDVNTRFLALWKIEKKDVALPSEIREAFEAWKRDPKRVLEWNSSRIPKDPQRHYDYALTIRTAAVSNRILWRFVATVYHDVISEHSKPGRYVCEDAVEFLVAVICASPVYDRTTVYKNVKTWAREGKRYRAIANTVGGTWCYFFLPDSISENMWKTYLPQDAYGEAATLLHTYGILEKAQKSGAIDLSARIEETLKTPFRSTVQTQVQGQGILSSLMQQRNSHQREIERPGNGRDLSSTERKIAKRKPAEGLFNPPKRSSRSSPDLVMASGERASTYLASTCEAYAVIAPQHACPAQVNLIASASSMRGPQKRNRIAHQRDSLGLNKRLSNEFQSMQSGQLVLRAPHHDKDQNQCMHMSRYIELTPSLGSHFRLCTPIMVPDDAQSIKYAINGNIEGLMDLFSRGLATPWDISNTREFSLIRWALYGGMCNFKTVQFLIDHGATVDEVSYQHVWDYAWRTKCSAAELKELQCIASRPPSSHINGWVEEQEFPPIHQLLFERHRGSVSTELRVDRSSVHLTDASGRTALDWATALGRVSDMEVLIQLHSPLNTKDREGRTTLLHAVDSHNTDALRILLEAGASPNPIVPEGQFRSSPLVAASFGGLFGMMQLLLEWGAEVDACNPEGRTALHTVASRQDANYAELLLSYGANMHLLSKNGHSPFTTAIICNNHSVLEYFITRWCDSEYPQKPRLLPLIAGHADVKTISILGVSPRLRSALDEGDLVLSRDTLRSREDYDEPLRDSFENLVAGRVVESGTYQ